MSKIIGMSVAVVLLVGSNAFATLGTISQIQETQIGLANTLELMQGTQGADAIQNLAVSNGQLTDAACSGVAEQSLLANLAEIGHASGECAIVGVGQVLAAVGEQQQLIADGCGQKTQGQVLGLTAGQQLIKAEGPGAGEGLHQIVLREDQYGSNNAGTMQESSAVLGLQSSNLNGAACATGSVDSTMTVTTVQSQATL